MTVTMTGDGEFLMKAQYKMNTNNNKKSLKKNSNHHPYLIAQYNLKKSNKDYFNIFRD